MTTTTGCSWTAVSSASWITISSGASGSGNGTVLYTVAANTLRDPRTGTLTVGGQTLSVTQDAAHGRPRAPHNPRVQH
jgi:ABC-type histidine transport system ATPase subunit